MSRVRSIRFKTDPRGQAFARLFMEALRPQALAEASPEPKREPMEQEDHKIHVGNRTTHDVDFRISKPGEEKPS